MQTEYAARVLKLRLPGQNTLTSAPERCSADPVMLETIGRSIGEQVRINRKDDSRFVALYTVKQANPDADLRNPARANVVRTGRAGRDRLGTNADIQATVQAKVVDAAPEPGAPSGVSFFEVADDDWKQPYFIAIAPHGGQIERHTDDQAVEAVRHLCAAGIPASSWSCRGYGDAVKGASDRWHITSTDINPVCFPLLQPLMSRRFRYGVAFHGFHRKGVEADVYIGGGASRPLKIAIESALNDLDLPLKVKISTSHDSRKFQGFSVDNITNRIAKSGIHLEQSAQARKYYREIAHAVAQVFDAHLRFWIWTFIEDLKTQRIKREAEFVQALSKNLASAPLNVEGAIGEYRTWKAIDDALAATIKTADELQSFDESKADAHMSQAKKG